MLALQTVEKGSGKSASQTPRCYTIRLAVEILNDYCLPGNR